MSKVCCPTDLKPVSSNYARKGANYYLTGLTDDSFSQSNAILLVPDIFSFHPNAFQLADTLAAEGYTVLIPNFFGESPGWPLDTPIDFNSDDWGKFYSEHVTQFDRHLSVIESSTKFLKALGAKKIGSIGMCWGSKVALMAATKWKDMFCTLVLPHPSFFDAETGKGVTASTFIMPSGEEKDEIMKQVIVNLKASNPASEHKRYESLHHGFLGARGYFPGSLSKMPEEYMKATEEALTDALDYFKKNFQS